MTLNTADIRSRAEAAVDHSDEMQVLLKLAVMGDSKASADLSQRISRLRARIVGLAKASQEFVDRVNEIGPRVDGMIALAAIHGASWPADANWVKERDALLDALKEIEP